MDADTAAEENSEVLQAFAEEIKLMYSREIEPGIYAPGEKPPSSKTLGKRRAD